jgi:hypothetical protein
MSIQEKAVKNEITPKNLRLGKLNKNLMTGNAT